MKMRSYLLIATALVLPAGGVMLERSMAVSAAQPASPVAPEIAAAPADPRQPVDAGYAVPGVFDYRSWKPEYDRMPATRVATYVRRRAAPAQLTAPDQPDQARAAPLATALPQSEDVATPAESGVVPNDVSAPSVQG